MATSPAGAVAAATPSRCSGGRPGVPARNSAARIRVDGPRPAWLERRRGCRDEVLAEVVNEWPRMPTPGLHGDLWRDADMSSARRSPPSTLATNLRSRTSRRAAIDAGWFAGVGLSGSRRSGLPRQGFGIRDRAGRLAATSSPVRGEGIVIEAVDQAVGAVEALRSNAHPGASRRRDPGGRRPARRCRHLLSCCGQAVRRALRFSTDRRMGNPCEE